MLEVSFYDHSMSVVYCVSTVVCCLAVTDNSSYTTESNLIQYCKFRNFCKILFSRHICDVKNSLQGHDLPISIKDRVISTFREDFIFTKLRICEVSRK